MAGAEVGVIAVSQEHLFFADLAAVGGGDDEELLENMKADHKVVITLEDGILDGGFGEKISRFYGSSDVKTLNFGLKKEFLDRYNVEDILKENHLTPEQIAEDVAALI